MPIGEDYDDDHCKEFSSGSRLKFGLLAFRRSVFKTLTCKPIEKKLLGKPRRR